MNDIKKPSGRLYSFIDIILVAIGFSLWMNEQTLLYYGIGVLSVLVAGIYGYKMYQYKKSQPNESKLEW